MSKRNREIAMEQLYGSDKGRLLGQTVPVDSSPLFSQEPPTNSFVDDVRLKSITDAILDRDDKSLLKALAKLEESLTPTAKEVLLNSSDAFGNSLMHYAVIKGEITTCEILIAQAISPDMKNNEGSTPLHLAIRYNNQAVAKWLIEKGADVEVPNNHGSLPLHLAVELCLSELSFIIIERMKGSFNVKDHHGNTFLHYASLTGDKKLCEKLLESGARIDAQNKQASTPVHLAACHYTDKIMELLLNNEISSDKEILDTANMKMGDGRTALHIACRIGSIDVVKLLVELGVSFDTEEVTSPLHVAAISGVKSIVQLLLYKNANVDAKDGSGKTALHYAAMFGNDGICFALLEDKADIDAQDQDGYTPLLYAVVKGHHYTVQSLLQKGANVAVGNRQLRTCLHFAVLNEDFKMVEILLPHRCYIIRLRDINLQTSLHYAAFVGNETILKLLLRNYLSVEDTDSRGRNALHIAVENGHEDAVRLLTLGASQMHIQGTDDNNMTALHLAAIKGYANICAYLTNMKANPDVIDKLGRSPLHYAVLHDHEQVTKILLESGASVDLADEKGKTPVLLAVKHQRKAPLNVLLDYNAKLYRRVGDKVVSILSEAVDMRLNDMGIFIVSHKRWSEAKQQKEVWGPEVMKKLIVSAPDVAEVVMYNAIEYSHEFPDKKDLTVTYYFDMLEVPLKEKATSRVQGMLPPTRNVQSSVLQQMVKHERSNLLEHPLTSAYLMTKWKSFAGLMFFLSLLTYMFFLGSVTAMVLQMRAKNKRDTEKEMNKTRIDGRGREPPDPRAKPYGQFLGTIALVFSFIMIIGHFIQIYVKRKRYFYDMKNLVEWALFFIAFLYMSVFLFKLDAPRLGNKDQIGGILIFLAWCNFLLYLQNLQGFRLYIIMFLEVLATLLKVILIFAVVLIGFALTYYHLLSSQETYNSFARSFVKTMSMAIDGTDYDAVVIDNLRTFNEHSGLRKVPFPELSMVIIFLFMLVISIALMNLLVGLAVGDIDSIRQMATVQSIKQQVEFLVNLQTNIPTVIYRRLYKSKGVFTPNKKSRFDKVLNAVLPAALRWETMDHTALLRQRLEEEKGIGGEGESSMATMMELMNRQMEELQSLKKRFDEQDQLIKGNLYGKSLPTPPVYFSTAPTSASGSIPL